MFDFNSGIENADTVVVGGGKVKNEVKAAEGIHEARIRSIVHLGVSESFDYNTKKSKGFFPKAVVVFELKEEGDFETDGETPLVITKDFEIKKGEKANFTTLLNAFTKDDGTTATTFDELIGCSGNVEIVHRGDYVNMLAWNKGGITAINPKYKKNVGALSDKGVGNVKYTEINKAALEELHAWNHVADILMKSTEFAGSAAEAAIAEIRAIEGRENYAIKKAKTAAPKAEATPVVDLADDEEF